MPRYNQSSPYPTGRAPLAVDLSQQMWNIAQQRIQNRKQEIEEQQKEISETEKILLTALDFETVKGAQDMFAQDMASRIDQVSQKWSQRMKDKGGILDTKDKLELLRDKRDIENRIQVGAADVAQFEQFQKDLSDPKKREIFDVMPMASDMAKYAAEKKIGTGGAINLAKLKPQPVGQDFMAEVEGLAKTMGINTNLSQEPTGIREDGQTKWKFTNEPMVNNLVARAQMLPSFQNLAKENYGQAMELLNSIPKYYKIERYDYERDAAGSTAGGKTAAQIKAETEQNEKFGSFNNLALNLMDMDAETINSLTSTEPGQINDIYYEQAPDGGTDMVVDFSQKSASGVVIPRPAERIRVPKDMSDNETRKTFYNKLWQILPDDVKKGVEFSDVPKTMKPRSGKFSGRQVPYRNIQKIENKVNEVTTNPKRGIFKAAADSLNTWLKKVNPQAPKIEGTKEGFLVGPEGQQKEYKFVNPPEGTVNTPEAFKKQVMSNINPPKVGDPNAPEAESTAPKIVTYKVYDNNGVAIKDSVGNEMKFYIPEDQIFDFVKENPSARRQ